MRKILNFIKRFRTPILDFLGLLGIAFGVYTYFNPFNQNAKLVFSLDQNADVYQINDSLKDLSILFKGNDLKSSKRGLRIYKIKLINEGKSGFDLNNKIFGIQVNNASILSVIKLEASDDFIKKSVKLNLYDSSKVLFSNLLLKPDEFLDFKLVVLTNPTGVQSLAAIGKFPDTDIIVDTEGNRDWAWETSKNIGLGLIVLFVIVFVAIALIEMLFDSIDFIKRKSRSLRFKILLGYEYSNQNRNHRFLKTIYSQNNHKDYAKFLEVLADEEKLTKYYYNSTDSITILRKFKRMRNENKVKIKGDLKDVSFDDAIFNMISKCIDEKFITQNEDSKKLILQEEFKNEVILIARKVYLK